MRNELKNTKSQKTSPTEISIPIKYPRMARSEIRIYNKRLYWKKGNPKIRIYNKRLYWKKRESENPDFPYGRTDGANQIKCLNTIMRIITAPSIQIITHYNPTTFP